MPFFPNKNQFTFRGINEAKSSSFNNPPCSILATSQCKSRWSTHLDPTTTYAAWKRIWKDLGCFIWIKSPLPIFFFWVFPVLMSFYVCHSVVHIIRLAFPVSNNMKTHSLLNRPSRTQVILKNLPLKSYSKVTLQTTSYVGFTFLLSVSYLGTSFAKYSVVC